MASTLPLVDDQLVRALFTTSNRSSKLISSSVYSAPAAPDVMVRSWRMNEFKYYDLPSPFPTLARGLFTTWVRDDEKGHAPPACASDEGEKGSYRIVARGYDKFFNIGEVPWTSWAALEKNTVGPYHLTLKSNGCIIFMAALSPDKLIITSKHSLGPIKGSDVSHAEMGERWLLRSLKQAGKTPEEFAKTLWDNNWTAVAELCDDSFEEHVLAYSQEKTGLHLHGINESVSSFRTVDPARVSKFATEWGFIPTAFHTEETIAGVRAFAASIETSKCWNGEPIEGFVVRSHISSSASDDRATAPPYPAGSSFFFKIKYDEPYMMYRDWRELTKLLLRSPNKPLHQKKMRRPETKLYVEWVKAEIERDKSQFELYTKGKGIISTRDRFLEYLTSKEGHGRLETTAQEDAKVKAATKDNFGKTIIVPIAVPGVGKTMIAVALKTLFGFGHIQSDDIKVKKPAPHFVKKVVEELATKDVVIADRNNHLHKHRDELRKAVAKHSPAVRLLALHWALDTKPHAIIHRICSDRVFNRGANHQSLVPNEENEHEDIIWKFINQSEDVLDEEVDEEVDMDVEADFESNLAVAIDACVRVLGLPRPSQEEVGRAMAAARGYEPATKAEGVVKKAAKPPRYFALVPELDITQLVSARLAQADTPDGPRRIWEALVENQRNTTAPHITLVHGKMLPDGQALWDRCKALSARANPPDFEVRVTHLVCDSRVMSLAVEGIRAVPSEADDGEGEKFVSSLDENLKGAMHITVGTRDKDIPPLEGRTIVENWKKGGASAEGIFALPLEDVRVRGTVKGLMS